MGKATKFILEELAKRAKSGDALAVTAIAASQSQEAEASFLGAGAKFADKMMLEMAQKMEQSGLSPDDIWQKTGWGKGVDDKWRFEVEDRGLNMDAMQKTGFGGYSDYSTQRLGDVYDSDAIKNYPELGKYEQSAIYTDNPDADISGAFEPDSKRVRATGRTAEDTGGILAHETQHAVQELEGFAKGGSPDRFVNEFDYEKIRDPLAQFHEDAMKAGIGDDFLLERPSDLASIPMDEYVDSVLAKANIDDSTTAGANLARELEWSASRLTNAADEAILSPQQQYRRLAGEVEARNVQKRMSMTPTERRAKAPWLTEDVPRSRQTIKYGGALGAGTTAALYTPEQNQAMAGQLTEMGIEDVGSITADEYPQLESIADFLDKYIQTPLDPLMGSPLEGVSGYLRDFGRKDRTTGERLGSAYGAALDILP